MASAPSTAPSKGPSFYRPELDGLRFAAFLGVFVCHAIPQSNEVYLRQGFSTFTSSLVIATSKAGAFGVDLFFVLSSYLITELLLREKQASGTIHLKAFYVRRILRIWPLYFFALLITFGWRLVEPAQAMQGTYLLSYALFVGNWISAIFGPPHSFMSILWSVSIEEQFYLSWPAFLRKVSREGIITTGCALLVLSAAARAWVAMYMPSSESMLWESTLTRLDPFAAGMLLAVALRGKMPGSGSMTRLVALAAGAAIWLAAGWTSSRSLAYAMLGYPAVTVGAVLIFLAVAGSRLHNEPLQFLGKISYGLYVYHMMSLHIGAMVLGERIHHTKGFGLYVVGSFVATLGVASISYIVLEKPFLRLKERFTFVHSRPA